MPPAAAAVHVVTHPHLVHVLVAVVILHPHMIRAAVVVHGQVTRFGRWVASVTAGITVRRPAISVITPTWRRRKLLLERCVPSVLAQAYAGPVEHVIVSDGPDPELAGVPGVRFLPEHREAPGRGVLARLEALRHATGDLIAYLDDDNAWRPGHLAALAGAIEREHVSFAYSQALCRNAAGYRWVVGCSRPVFAQIDTSLIVHRRELLETATWQVASQPADWDLVERWLAAGATWAHVPEITLDYYARSGADALA